LLDQFLKERTYLKNVTPRTLVWYQVAFKNYRAVCRADEVPGPQIQKAPRKVRAGQFPLYRRANCAGSPSADINPQGNPEIVQAVGLCHVVQRRRHAIGLLQTAAPRSPLLRQQKSGRRRNETCGTASGCSSSALERMLLDHIVAVTLVLLVIC
jgi:hypothetical protein